LTHLFHVPSFLFAPLTMNSASQFSQRTPTTPNVDQNPIQPLPYAYNPAMMQQGMYNPQMMMVCSPHARTTSPNNTQKNQFYQGMPLDQQQAGILPGLPTMAVPIGALMRVPAPVECPVCNKRDYTVTKEVVGNGNQ
jgi:hypothetical protein